MPIVTRPAARGSVRPGRARLSWPVDQPGGRDRRMIGLEGEPRRRLTKRRVIGGVSVMLAVSLLVDLAGPIGYSRHQIRIPPILSWKAIRDPIGPHYTTENHPIRRDEITGMSPMNCYG